MLVNVRVRMYVVLDMSVINQPSSVVECQTISG